MNSQQNATDNRLGYWKENIRRSLKEWAPWKTLIGLVGPILVLLGYDWLADEPSTRVVLISALFAYLAVQVLVTSPWSMWDDAKTEIAAYRDRLTPRLSLVFDEKVPPFHQVHITQDVPLIQLRQFRVGVRNESDAVIKGVRVVLESLTPYYSSDSPLHSGPEQPGLIEHPLNVMGSDKKSGRSISLQVIDRRRMSI
jgi:hypothetical protein